MVAINPATHKANIRRFLFIVALSNPLRSESTVASHRMILILQSKKEARIVQSCAPPRHCVPLGEDSTTCSVYLVKATTYAAELRVPLITAEPGKPPSACTTYCLPLC